MDRMTIFLLLFLPQALFAYDIRKIRLEYNAAVNDEKKADEFYSKLEKMRPLDPLLLAYFGSAEAVKAKHALNPYSKLAYLKSGSKTLNLSVSKSPDNLEIRFLRFTLEHYVPKFLGYSKHLPEDKKKIIDLIAKRQFGEVDSSLLKNIISFMKESRRCTKAELEVLNKALPNG